MPRSSKIRKFGLTDVAPWRLGRELPSAAASEGSLEAFAFL
jgi:hypothetical protein